MKMFLKTVFSMLVIVIIMFIHVVTSDLVLKVTFLKHIGRSHGDCQKTKFGVYPFFDDKKPLNYSLASHKKFGDTINSWTGEINMDGETDFSNVVNRTIEIRSTGSVVKRYLWLYIQPNEECSGIAPLIQEYSVWYNGNGDFRNITDNINHTITVRPKNYTHSLELHIEVHCAVNYYDNMCNTYCLGNPSLHYFCNEDGNKTCYPGYRFNETNGQCEDINECLLSPCENNATCVNNINSYSCNCLAGFTGINCIENINDCLSSPCENNGTCSDGINSYICNCKPGFTGYNCSINIDDCESGFCENNGTCVDGVNSYHCDCLLGFDGFKCSNNVDECDPKPCENNGTCVDGVHSYHCECLAGFTGVNCSKNIDDCLPMPCENHSTCNDGVNTYTCICEPGFTGRNCSVDINECIAMPCENNGTCHNGKNSYTCTCMPGFTGLNCNEDIDECSSLPCQNNGSCVDQKDNYTCTCINNFAGKNCEIKPTTTTIFSTTFPTSQSPYTAAPRKKSPTTIYIGAGTGAGVLFIIIISTIICIKKRRRKAPKEWRNVDSRFKEEQNNDQDTYKDNPIYDEKIYPYGEEDSDRKTHSNKENGEITNTKDNVNKEENKVQTILYEENKVYSDNHIADSYLSRL